MSATRSVCFLFDLVHAVDDGAEGLYAGACLDPPAPRLLVVGDFVYGLLRAGCVVREFGFQLVPACVCVSCKNFADAHVDFALFLVEVVPAGEPVWLGVGLFACPGGPGVAYESPEGFAWCVVLPWRRGVASGAEVGV